MTLNMANGNRMQFKNYLIGLAVTMSICFLALAMRGSETTILHPVAPESVCAASKWLFNPLPNWSNVRCLKIHFRSKFMRNHHAAGTSRACAWFTGEVRAVEGYAHWLPPSELEGQFFLHYLTKRPWNLLFNNSRYLQNSQSLYSNKKAAPLYHAGALKAWSII